MRFLGLGIGRRRRRPSGRFTTAEIDRALLELPELERAVYLNHRLGGMSYRRIAKRLGITVDEVEQIVARTLYHFHCELQDIERERRS